MNHFGTFDFEGFYQCTANPAINSQFIAEVESMKKGLEASTLQLEESLSKLQSSIASIPALVEGELNKQLAVIPSLVEEAVKTQLRAFIPELVQQVEGASIAVPAFLPLSQSLPQPITTRASAQQDESSNLHLKFAGNLPEPKSLFTKEDIKDQGASLKVELHDQFGNKVNTGPESSAKIKLFVVAGDFEIEDGGEDISKHAVTPREDKPPLLKGKSEISLVEGVASASEIAFTDNSKFVRKGMFKLGAQVIKGVSPGVSIKGAVSDAFQVKEYRNTFNKKPPGSLSLDDEVSNLINIGKGKTLEKLQDIGIHLVKDLLNLYDTDFNKLLKIFRGDKKKLSKTIEMAKSCAESALPNQYQIIPDNSQKQLGETSKQIEQTHIPPQTNLTSDEAASCSIIVSAEMAFCKTMHSFQGVPAMQPDGVLRDTPRELGTQSPSCTAFQNHQERPEFYSAASYIHRNATGADQGVPAMQPDGILRDTPREESPQTSLFPAFLAKSCAESALANQYQIIPDNSQKQLGETLKQIEQTHIPPLTNLTTDEVELLETVDSFLGLISYQAGETSSNFPEFQLGNITVSDYEDTACYMEIRLRPRWPIWHVVLAVLRFRVIVKVPAEEGLRAGKRQKHRVIVKVPAEEGLRAGKRQKHS